MVPWRRWSGEELLWWRWWRYWWSDGSAEPFLKVLKVEEVAAIKAGAIVNASKAGAIVNASKAGAVGAAPKASPKADATPKAKAGAVDAAPGTRPKAEPKAVAKEHRVPSATSNVTMQSLHDMLRRNAVPKDEPVGKKRRMTAYK